MKSFKHLVTFSFLVFMITHRSTSDKCSYWLKSKVQARISEKYLANFNFSTIVFYTLNATIERSSFCVRWSRWSCKSSETMSFTCPCIVESNLTNFAIKSRKLPLLFRRALNLFQEMLDNTWLYTAPPQLRASGSLVNAPSLCLSFPT